jgi:subtilisin-like proprotein convertase family protein
MAHHRQTSSQPVKPHPLRLALAALLGLQSALASPLPEDPAGHWLDGDRVRPLTRLPDQHVFLLGGASPENTQRLQRRLGDGITGLRLVEQNDFLLRVEGAVDADREKTAEALLGDPGRAHELLPVYRGGDPLRPQILIAGGELIVGLRGDLAGAAARLAADTPGLRPLRSLPWGNAYLFGCPDPTQCLALSLRLASRADVTFAYPNWVRDRRPRQWPQSLSLDPLVSGQWHLNGLLGEGVRALAAWPMALGSARKVIGVVDAGCELGHPDLQPNVAAGLSWDYVEGDADPEGPPHGTAVAGLAAARGGNGIGGSGVAPLATFAAIRLDPAFTDINESLALLHQVESIAIYNNSWGPPDDGHLEGPGPVTIAALASGTRQGRGGLGAIYVWAAGNGGALGDNANYDGYANQPYVMAVGATNRYGRQTYYSEPGANLWLNAPGGDDAGWLTTTDLSGWRGYDRGDYTEGFGGTSGSAALVSGTAALVLDARPDLGWRELRWLLAASAERNDPADDDWMTNGAGLWVNHKYGFGRVDAAGAVAAAPEQPPLPQQQVLEYRLSGPIPIPDGAPAGVELRLDIPEDLVVEYVQATLDSDHPSWGELAITLVSPAGTPSRLAEPHASGGAQLLGGWTFGSARLLGEQARGSWRLRVVDPTPGHYGGVRHWTLRLYGHRTGEEPPPAQPDQGATPIPTLSSGARWLLGALLALLALPALRRGRARMSAAVAGPEVA